MQTIIHEGTYEYLHPIFLDFELLYRELSNNDEPNRLIGGNVFDRSMNVFEGIFNLYGDCEKQLNYTVRDYPKLSARPIGKNIIIGFSGGKDSTATALYYKQRGFNVYLYHVHGLNKFFPQELQSAQEVADTLGLPLIVENVKLSGKSLYPDHPLKNIIIANMMVQWGIKNGIGVRLAMGNYYTVELDDVEFSTAGDDTREMWQAYKSVIKKYVPKLKIEFPLEDITTTFRMLSKERGLIEKTQSCVMTYRFKESHRKRIQKTFGIELMPNRCGCCWKCAVEYIYFADHDVLPYVKDYYIHCFAVLMNTIWKETACFPYDVNYIWNVYLFYPMEESKAYKELKNAFIYARKIIIADKIS